MIWRGRMLRNLHMSTPKLLLCNLRGNVEAVTDLDIGLSFVQYRETWVNVFGCWWAYASLTLLLPLFFAWHTGIYGYHGNKKEPFLRITLAIPRLVAAAKRLLDNSFAFGSYPPMDYQAYESNTEFEIRCENNYENFLIPLFSSPILWSETP